MEQKPRSKFPPGIGQFETKEDYAVQKREIQSIENDTERVQRPLFKRLKKAFSLNHLYIAFCFSYDLVSVSLSVSPVKRGVEKYQVVDVVSENIFSNLSILLQALYKEPHTHRTHR